VGPRDRSCLRTYSRRSSSPATERVQERRDLAVCIFLIKKDAKTESHKHWPISYLQSGCNVLTIELFPGAEPVEHAIWKFDCPITIIESSSPSVCLPRTWPIPSRTRATAVSKQPCGTGSCCCVSAYVQYPNQAQLTLSRPYSARKLEISDCVMEYDLSESKKRERSGRPSLANSSTYSSRIKSNYIFCGSA
jgi:hypothetical protein